MKKALKPWYRASRDAWYVCLNGKQIKLAEGKPNRKQAEREFHRLMAETPGSLPQKMIVGQVCDLFLIFSERHHEKATFDWYKNYLQNFCTKYGKSLIAALKPFHVYNWLDDNEWNDGSRRAAITCVKRVMNWGEDRGLMEASPIRKVKKPKEQARDRILDLVERQKILGAIRDQQFRDFIFAMQETGARPGEVRKVTAAHCNLEAGIWIFKKHKTFEKTKKDRIIYLTKPVIELCRVLIAKYPEGPLFRGPRGAKPFTSNGVRCRFRNLRLKLPELAGAIAYSYRHSFATDALEKGVPAASVSELLGHEDLSMLSRYYSKLSQKTQHLREAAERARA